MPVERVLVGMLSFLCVTVFINYKFVYILYSIRHNVVGDMYAEWAEVYACIIIRLKYMHDKI